MAERRPPRIRRRAELDACLVDSERAGRETSPPEDRDSYEVGYGKPPRHTRFKPGQSGNPRGRPKSPKAFDDLIEKELDELVTVREGDRARRLPKRRVIVKQVVMKAMEGEDRALRSLIFLLTTAKTERQKAVETGEANPDLPLTKTEKSILAEYEAQVREKILQEQEQRAKQPASVTAKPLKEPEE